MAQDKQSEENESLHTRFTKGPIVKGRPTLAQVAKASRSSVSTVSAVLNNRSDCWASKETRERIHEAARKLGYRANLAARTLRGGRTQTIGLITGALNVEANAKKVQAFEEEARRHNYVTMIGFSPNDEALEDKLLQNLADRHVDGIAVYPVETGDHKAFLELQGAGLPLVTMDAEGRSKLDCDDITTDYHAGGMLQGQFLIGKGRRRIAQITSSPNCYNTRELRRGMADIVRKTAGCTMLAWDVPCDPHMGSFLAEESYQFIRKLMEKNKGKFDAVACPDILACGAVRAALELGLRVPQDVSVIGFDDAPIAMCNTVPLTTVAQPTREIGARLFHLLRERIERLEENPPHQRILIKPTTVVERASA